METCLNYTNAKEMYFSSDERKWITKIRKLKEKNPNEVVIIRQPEENDGCIYARLPVEYLKIGPKRRLALSDEQRAIAAERLKSLRKTRDEKGDRDA